MDLNDNFGIHGIAPENSYENGKLQKKLIIAGMKRIFIVTYNRYLFYITT
jgi:hypothetical protein